MSQVWSYLRNKIASAREAIYNLDMPIKGAAVERLLKDHSLILTLVSVSILTPEAKLICIVFEECVHGTALTHEF